MYSIRTFIFTIISLLGLMANAQSKGITIKSDPRIDRLLDLRISSNSQGKMADGYVIQIYYGRSDGARNELDAFVLAYPNIKAVIEYDNPDYKVFVGGYITKDQADTELRQLKQNPKYSGAFIRPKSILIN